MCDLRILTTANLDYLSARLHGRRSRMAEGDRLETLCRLRSVSELARHVWPDREVPTVADFQHRLVEDLIGEISALVPLLDQSGARLLEWMLIRLQVKVPTERISWEAFAASLPAGPLRTSVQEASRCPARPFYMEAALDRGYYQELLTRAEALPSEEHAVVEPLLRHAAETVRRQWLARGQMNYSLTAEDLALFAEAGTGQISEMPDEASASNQLYRLANQAMRRNPIGLGTVIGYVILRQIEIANLITISEGIRLEVPAEMIRARMIPRSVVHV